MVATLSLPKEQEAMYRGWGVITLSFHWFAVFSGNAFFYPSVGEFGVWLPSGDVLGLYRPCHHHGSECSCTIVEHLGPVVISLLHHRAYSFSVVRMYVSLMVLPIRI